MGKIMTSARRKIVFKKPKKTQKKELSLNLEDFEGIGKEHNPSEYLSNPDNIGRAILECLENNDPQGVMEVIAIYLEKVNKSKLSEGKLHRQTVYSALKHKNPTIKTLARLMHRP
jgi:DNA-binding phage protein